VRPAIDAFEKQHANIKVRFQQNSYADTHKKLLTSLAAGGGAPDVCSVGIDYVGAFSAKGGLVDLLQPPYDGGQFKNDMVVYKWTQASTADGRLIAMPWDIGPAGLWYRADLFEKAGLEVDPEKVQARVKRWDDWFQLGEDLKKKTPNTALVADAFTDILGSMIEQQGHGWFNGNKVVIEEKLAQPLQRAVDARKRGVDAKIDWWGAEWSTGVKKDVFAGMGVACWMQIFLKRDEPQTVGKWRVIHAPEGDYNQGGSFLSVREQGKNKEAAWEFVKYICCSTEGQNNVFRTAGFLPSYKPAWKDPLYDQPVEFFGGQKAYRLWLDIADKVPANVVNPDDQQANDIVNAEITKVKKEGKDAAAAAKDAEAETLRRVKGVTG
jgi:multiple sugar transport system substrate-binding protein